MVNTKLMVGDFYQNYYESVFVEGGSLSNWGYKITHKLLERGMKGRHFPNVLEIGAGNGEHVDFVRHSFDRYLMVDKEKPKNEIRQPKTVFEISDIADCKFPECSFERIIITCVLHHLSDPYMVLSRAKSWLAYSGVISIFLPCDPGLFNRVFRNCL